MPTEQQLADFLTEHPLPDHDNDWTWWDDDRNVAWGVPDSYHGKLAAIYQEAGWTPCYHDYYGRTAFHINVKVYGNYQLVQDMYREIEEESFMSPGRVNRVVEGIVDSEMSWWWEQLDGGVEYLLSEDRKDTGLSSKDYWSDGRMGGWLHVSNSWAATHPEEMILLAEHARESVKYYASRDWYDYIKEVALEAFSEDPEAGKERCHSCGQLVETEDLLAEHELERSGNA